MNIDHDSICAALRQTASEEILPLWRNLEAHQVELKRADDAVTDADRNCERVLGARLAALLPGSRVVGEEAVHADPSLLQALHGDAPVWILDPVDGTNNFATGEGPFAVMAALVLRGETLGAWIHDPVRESMLRAERGAGAYLDDAQLSLSAHAGAVDTIEGALSGKYLPEALRPAARKGAARLGRTWASGCAAFDYLTLVTGGCQFLFYYRTLAWDHAPGVLIANEAGAVTGRYDGSPYLPTSDATGLICACDQATWDTVRDTLLPAPPHTGGRPA